MKPKPDSIKIISKYALILVCFYLLEIVVNYAYRYAVKNPPADIHQLLWIGLIPFGMIIFNVITAIILAKDIKNYQLKTNYLIVLTLVFRPLGVCLFLISYINQRSDERVPEVSSQV